MSKVYIFTPTCRFGGVDVTLASLQRQSEQDFTWIVSDDLEDQRHDMWDSLSNQVNLIWGKSPERKEGDYRNLVAAYNSAVEIALEDPDAVLFVTLQDYIWVPPNGLERFLWIRHDHPNDLISGLTSISADPFPSLIHDPEGHFTIFAEPYTSKPRFIDWSDCRWRGSGVRPGNHIEWEANWGAVPMKLLRDGYRWTPEYDKGVAYENQDFAMKAVHYNKSSVWIDNDNHAISLPHKKYFPAEEKRDAAMINKDWHEARWREIAPELVF